MHIDIQTFTVHKRFALTISRGTTAKTTNLWLRLEHEGLEGWGEASPFSIGSHPQTTENLVATLQEITPLLEKFTPLDRQQIEEILREVQLPSAACAAIDMALHDWLGKKVGLPLWQLWGIDRSRIVPTSVTIGINSPEGARQRVRDWFEKDNTNQESIKYRALKVKLGSSDGIDADRDMVMAVLDEAPRNIQVSIDANGGWNLKDAIKMCHWLEKYGIKYVEQPLSPLENIKVFSELYRQSPLPIFVDESCFNSRNIPRLANCVHGINIKMMKSGGLTEAMRMIHAAKAYGLQVMFGCYSDSILANTAAAQLSPLADYLDLDSHFNLIDDPFAGAVLENGCLLPNNLPGLGVYRIDNVQ
ncbi:dipeptide epimerase [Kamptonema sp. UHCC 0994]|uniref:mandelate racemase/muconate lactonizing enzyme family protein n=1 Tax=Kamptonema sp. UHCC 0994 TaxID=3031329 RepID=UPI0023B9A97B|nr:dipeptide epimerase [Kamptonema sp. UHCC 0994]MDF0553253.1 dipeptide epimerase [Kamptonema sp. UHCC 0994]